MKITKIILVVLGVVIVTALAMFWYAGAFSRLTVQEKICNQYIIAGKTFTGAYHTVSKPMDQVDSLLRSNNIQSTQGFGIYYDDPKSTPKEKCRSFVGNVINASDVQRLQLLKLSDIIIDTIESQPSLIIDFPSRSSLSYMVGPMRAYPLLVSYLTDKNYSPVMVCEIYDTPEHTTHFIMQIQK